MTKPKTSGSSKTFTGQTSDARRRANLNSQTVRVANDAARARNSHIDWDQAITNLKTYFAERDQ